VTAEEPSPSREQLAAAHCWEADDRVPGRPAMTAFRRRLRFHQARWRAGHGHPEGSQPIAPRPGGRWRPVGSRLPLDYAVRTGATFLTPGALAAATARTAVRERHQSIDRQRLWADLLWSPALCMNLFGDLAADPDLADRAVHAWWPDVPGTVSEVRFAHSPGWLDPDYLGNLISFDAAFVLDLAHGARGVLGVVTAYHDRVKRHLPKPARLPRYRAVMDRSDAFEEGAIAAVDGTDLLVLWLQHLLVQSMLQHPSGDWAWGRLVVVHPEGNSDHGDACSRYGDLLVDRTTFGSLTLERLLAAGALSAATTAALRDRYLPA
jgi:hypothetical protein